MLKIVLPECEDYFDPLTQEFMNLKPQVINLEHSLISLSKWESKWHKPFLAQGEKTSEETLDYIRCMTINYQNVDELVYRRITKDHVQDVLNYIDNPMTATWFTDEEKKKQIKSGRGGNIVTNEIIYYWMVALNIPFECEKWHLNRLLTLIRVCNEKMAPPKKMSKSEILSRNRALNDARRKALGTKG